jgi:hypothetical protein
MIPQDIVGQAQGAIMEWFDIDAVAAIRGAAEACVRLRWQLAAAHALRCA